MEDLAQLSYQSLIDIVLELEGLDGVCRRWSAHCGKLGSDRAEERRVVGWSWLVRFTAIWLTASERRRGH